MKKILVIHTGGFEPSGVTSVIMNYYEFINMDQCHIDFVAQDHIPEQYRKTMESRGSRVYILHRKKNPLCYMRDIYCIVKKQHYDVVHVHGNSATMFIDLFPAYMAGCKERIAHSHNSKCDHYIMHKLLLPFFRRVYTKALACSREAGEWIFGKDKFEVLSNGIDVERYCYSQEIRGRMRKRLNLEGKYVIGHVGFFNVQKNQEKLFSIFSELQRSKSNSHLLCITGSSYVPEGYLRLMKQLEIDNKVTILKQRDDVDELLQAMDVFVFPSKWEGLGMAVIEAQVSGLYCFVSENIPEEAYVTSRVRSLNLKKSDKIWAKAILSQKDYDKNRGETAKQFQNSKYNIKKSVYRLEDIYSGDQSVADSGIFGSWRQ